MGGSEGGLSGGSDGGGAASGSGGAGGGAGCSVFPKGGEEGGCCSIGASDGSPRKVSALAAACAPPSPNHRPQTTS